MRIVEFLALLLVCSFIAVMALLSGINPFISIGACGMMLAIGISLLNYLNHGTLNPFLVNPPEGRTDMKSDLDMEELRRVIAKAHLQECLDNECMCVDSEEHARNVKKARAQGLTGR